ncbi:hypothetical protein Acy02nite_03030 [Actinoplanes cyaneus]|uniref:Uncharacterized protein n=1 Tax=Actinoplanes cyaneus TaxID=52696 RepID=A0A919M1H9_9ACTN|nr:hypothetical protein [Actinoplanes cyaneus]MCW2136207.1 hypothetical protein [Actinoplanes cyaneus]GID62422.1 hypothetical protein Acy02nite_03030 [Actinoplanes cyaneus]
MSSLIRAELYRMATIRSSWVSLALFGAVAAAAGVWDKSWWVLFAGIGAFGISVLTVTQHYQHRTIALLYVARPRRFQVLLAQVVTTMLVAEMLAVFSGLPVWFRWSHQTYTQTLFVIPVMAAFGAGLAATVRRSAWLLSGFGVWFVIVEGIAGGLKWPLPMTSYLNASRSDGLGGDAFALEIFVFWAVTSLAVAAVALRRDLTGD